ncbi:Protein LSM14 B [Vanrija pseudolonga]|uniref:Protein LSM14 B n=1 Tax=Vanrija pseudolonga TaxID=143232 RepID=A0AAF1BN78_9TREE|nr:Protein LSM14 B [Vanrija pseudolonga]
MDYSQYKGRPFQVISKLKVRYTGIFQDIDQESQTICLSEVYNHGTEDRETARVLPRSSASLGWVRFHTNSIDSLALVENYIPPQSDEHPVDPILASVSKSGPSQSSRSGPSGAGLPPKPAGANSANAALDRVQKSLNDLSVDGGNRRRRPQAPAVPDTEFDFSKGNERFQQERQALKAANSDLAATKSKVPETVEVGELDEDTDVHPSVVAKEEEPVAAPKPQAKTASYKKADFFDNISADSSRVSRADERHRNYDTFGEAGGPGQQGGSGGQRYGGGGQRGGQRGGRGRGGGQRGGRGGFGHSQQGFVHTQ